MKIQKGDENMFNKPKETTEELANSPYSLLKPNDYYLPEEMLEDIENDVIKVTEDCISHGLIDELTPEEMDSDSGGEHYLIKYIHDCFRKPRIHLKKQKYTVENEVIQDIKMLQRRELERHRRLLDLAREELKECKLILNEKRS